MANDAGVARVWLDARRLAEKHEPERLADLVEDGPEGADDGDRDARSRRGVQQGRDEQPEEEEGVGDERGPSQAWQESEGPGQ